MKKITKFFIAVITVTSILLLCTACTDNIATPDEKGDIENPSEPSEPTPPTEPTNPSDPENPPVDEATIRKNNIAAAIAKNYDNDTVLYKQTEEGITKSDLYKNDGDFSYIKMGQR
jgi:outer membrane biogenesis lipoprotein LolB